MDPKLLMESATKLTDVTAKLGVIEGIKKKLVKQPDVAAMKLAAVLEELQKTLLAFETEVIRFLSITLGPGPDLRSDRSALYALEGQALWARMQAARGHCGKIENIYKAYLDPWFQRVAELDTAEREALAELFSDLSDSDGQMVGLLDQATWWLGEAANSVLEVFEEGRVEEANAAIAGFRKQVLPVRRALSKTMATLQNLEADFIGMSGVS